MTAHRLQSAAKFAGSAVGVLLATVGVLFLLLLGAYALPGGAVRIANRISAGAMAGAAGAIATRS